MVTYQHEKYVVEAIRSVLNQSLPDFELVIVNDGSTDSTADRIAEFNDPRIVTIHQQNQGPAAATNAAIAAARGKYIALFSGDDVCDRDRLKTQLDACSQGPRKLIFSCVNFIDDDGLPLSGDHFAASSFDNGQMTRAQILARLFHQGNFLNGVTTFGERTIFANAPYDPTLLQLQDFELWVRLIKSCDVQVVPDKCVSYRIRHGAGNLSAPVVDSIIRSANEHYLILRRFFDDLPESLFQEAFADLLVRPGFTGEIEHQCEVAFLYAKSTMPMARVIGIERLQTLLNDKSSATILAERYSFTPIQFFALLRTDDMFKVLGGYVSTLFLDTGNGFITGREVQVPINGVSGEFSLRFELPSARGLQALRWDPIERRTCRVSMVAIEYIDAEGNHHAVPADALNSNGRRPSPRTFDFETCDPSIWWPVGENVKSVLIRGHWEFDQLPETVGRLRRQVHDLQAALTTAQSTATNRMLRFARRTVQRLKAG